MKIAYDPLFVGQVKRAKVRVRKKVKTRLLLFSKNPSNPELHNHLLSREWVGYRSINITSDYRAIFEEVKMGKETIAYFVALGTHKELYR